MESGNAEVKRMQGIVFNVSVILLTVVINVCISKSKEKAQKSERTGLLIKENTGSFPNAGNNEAACYGNS